MQKTALYEMPHDNEMTAFFTISQTSDIPPPYSISNANIIMKNFEISSEHNHAIKSIEEIVETEILS